MLNDITRLPVNRERRESVVVVRKMEKDGIHHRASSNMT
jgi:hypothetical protein